ncbi:CD5 antigen-like [Heterodontus francisci]|uniref:CD5 antigen-like n=1 Tax=Heterodontus francisci TaxID=7792 RepID=UPI00355B96D9
MVSSVCFLLSIQIFTGLTSGMSSSIQGLCNTTKPVPTVPSFPATEIQNISLVGGSSHCSGQLHLQIKSLRLTLCPQEFSSREADVVCRELECGSTHAVVTGNFFDGQKAEMWNHSYACQNNETRLSRCIEVQRECHSADGVGIVCSGGYHEMRLQSGANRCQGEVQLYYNSSWSAVSGQLPSPDEAELMCKKLQCGHAVGLTVETAQMNPTVYVNDWTCLVTHPVTSDCLEGARKSEHPGTVALNCSEGEVPAFRLVDGRNPCVGKMEVFHRGFWKPVCQSQMDFSVRNLVCSELECTGLWSRWNGPGLIGKNRTGATICVKCRSQTVQLLTDKKTLWHCQEERRPFEQMNITCKDPRSRGLPKVRKGLSGSVTACVVLVILLVLLLLLAYGWKQYQRNGKQVFRRKQTQRQWIGPTGATSHAVSFHRNNNANARPASSQSTDGNVYMGTPQKDTLSAYPALERRANLPANPRDNSSDSDYDFFDTHAQRL